VFGLFFLLPHRWRWGFLLAASYYFYMSWNPVYVFLILLTTVITYTSGILIAGTDSKKKKLAYLISSLAVCLGILFFYKYCNFFNDILNLWAHILNFGWHLPQFALLLPVGISFYVFQSLSYSIDVYRGIKEPERHFGIYALYVSFFPQLVAGPIERSTSLLPQLRRQVIFDYERAATGLQLMAWGFFKKLAVADGLAIFVNQVYNNVENYYGWSFVLATILFAFQLYGDFSGYSDIAIGGSQALGYDLMKNFNRPYFARSISGFWRRWHISLSTWLHDYLYYPLSYRFRSSGRRGIYLSTIITFVLCGLWHGAGWNYIIMGALFGIYIVSGLITKNWRANFVNRIGLAKLPLLHQILQVIITFSLVCFAWIFFRANTGSDAFYIIRHLFTVSPYGWLHDLYIFQNNGYEFALAIIGLVIMEAVQLTEELSAEKDIIKIIRKKPAFIRWLVYFILIMLIFVMGAFGSQEFIYFQF